MPDKKLLQGRTCRSFFMRLVTGLFRPAHVRVGLTRSASGAAGTRIHRACPSSSHNLSFPGRTCEGASPG